MIRAALLDSASPSSQPRDRSALALAKVATSRRGLLLAAGFGLLLVVMIRNAWMSDDALITFRTIDNFVNGYGLRFNVAERVQAYTHPLWLLLLTPVYYFTREALYTPIFVSLACSALAVFLGVVRDAGWIGSDRASTRAVAAIVCLVSSKAFVDYTTSGLENPLGYLLVAIWLRLYLAEPARGDGARIGALVLVAALLFVNRMDAVLLVAPALCVRAVAVVRAGRPAASIGAACAGALPAVAWVAFSLFYYGIPVSNTAYAKLATGIDPSLLRSQGLFYLWHAIRFDPVTPLVVAAALVAAGVDAWRGTRRLWPIAAGIALQLAYVVEIGGDFMMGRFLSVPFFAAVVLLCRVDVPRGVAGVAAAVAFSLSIASPLSPLRTGADYENRDEETILENRGISDERGFYYARRGLLSDRRRSLRPGSACDADAERVVVRSVCGELGYEAFTGCRDGFLADRCALSDPLLARMPMIDPTSWRVGHYFRRVPRGYAASLERDENAIVDPEIRALYDDVRLATRAPLLAPGRFAAILRLNGVR